MIRTLKKAGFALAGIPYPLINALRDARWRGSDTAIALVSFDVDYTDDETAVPDILDVLAQYETRASFACIGRHVENNPAVYRDVVAAGHEIVNHTYNHPHNRELCPDRTWDELSTEEQREEIASAQSVFETKLDTRSVGFRLPHFGNLQGSDPDILYPMLADMGFRYSSSMLDFKLGGRAVVEPRSSGVLEIGITSCPYHPYTAMDTYHICRSKRRIYTLVHQGVGLIDSIKRSLDHCQRRRLPFNVYLDPLDVAGDVFKRFMEELARRDFRCFTYSEYIDGLAEQAADGKSRRD